LKNNILRVYLTTSVDGVRHLGYLMPGNGMQAYQLFGAEGTLIKHFSAGSIHYAISQAREYLYQYFRENYTG